MLKKIWEYIRAGLFFYFLIFLAVGIVIISVLGINQEPATTTNGSFPGQVVTICAEIQGLDGPITLRGSNGEVILNSENGFCDNLSVANAHPGQISSVLLAKVDGDDGEHLKTLTVLYVPQEDPGKRIGEVVQEFQSRLFLFNVGSQDERVQTFYVEQNNKE
ncbi:MAG TPA: hypothetical protein VJB99_01115 [Patescibacteria group bacterium]|nr:hypothetical protein [Patescibacteria group bacterium]